MGQANIYVPDELLDRVRAWKGRGLNISGVCAQALNREVDRLESAELADEAFRSAVARLLTSRSEGRDESERRGYEDGFGWGGELASFFELKEIASEATKGRYMLPENYREPADWLDMEIDSLSAYTKGFAVGVSDFWRRVEPLLR